MESHGASGTIQITQATYELIKDEFVCEPRGMMDVKGKGEMEVWMVVAAKEGLAEQGV
jgi:adenylate cyclase